MENRSADPRALPAAVPPVGWGVLPLLALGIRRACARGVADGARAVGWICAVVMLILLGLRGKFYDAGSIYPALAAVGCVVAEETTARWAARRRAADRSARWLRPVLAAGLVRDVLPELPVVLPLLPPSALAGSWEVKINHDFPEEFGWRELTAQMGRIFRGLPDAERAGTVVLTVNYGEAAAIQRFAQIPAAEMPVVSANNNYWHGKVIAEFSNCEMTTGDVTKHAETGLISAFSPKFDRATFAAATLYTSSEPCTMCCGAIRFAGIGRVVYGVTESQFERLIGGPVPDHPLNCRETLGRTAPQVKVFGPLMEAEGLALRESYWPGHPIGGLATPAPAR